jgi:cysteinyl-tRNA synthetase
MALDVLRELVSKTNVYISSQGKNINPKLVERIARWIGQMLRMFGLGEGESSEIGWGQERTGQVSFDVSNITN